MTDSELHLFFEDMVGRLRSRGVLCAITSGLACVHYGIAETTKDCDLLCHPGSFRELLNLLTETSLDGQPCRYRGHLSPPLDARWHHGGWTSHFQWAAPPEVTTLDVFGHALRESAPWPQDVLGLYAGPHTVAQMKRTNRDKDWSVITALGVRMVEADDERGWLHLFSADTLTELLQAHECPSEIVAHRPALRLAIQGDRRLAGALNAERRLWEELDRARIQLLEQKLRPYVSAVRQAHAGKQLALLEDHALRIDCAERHLPENPLKQHGIDKYVDDAKAALIASAVIPEAALAWLPDVRSYFTWLQS